MPSARASSSVKQRRRPAPRPLLHAAKITERQFLAVLAHFVRDDTATDTARRTGISANSVVGLFGKLRRFGMEIGLFVDPYQGQSPPGELHDNPDYERELLAFHLQRMRPKRGAVSPPGLPDPHLAESAWRFDFEIMRQQRPEQDIHPMMRAHLLSLIRACGPVGRPPVNQERGRKIMLAQLDQRILWLSRNAPEFKSAEARSALQAIREMEPAST